MQIKLRASTPERDGDLYDIYAEGIVTSTTGKVLLRRVLVVRQGLYWWDALKFRALHMDYFRYST